MKDFKRYISWRYLEIDYKKHFMKILSERLKDKFHGDADSLSEIWSLKRRKNLIMAKKVKFTNDIHSEVEQTIKI